MTSPSDPEGFEPDIMELEVLAWEIVRIVPEARPPAQLFTGIAFDRPFGDVFAALRALPDGAGWDVLRETLGPMTLRLGTP